jgi:hypothetical protein
MADWSDVIIKTQQVTGHAQIYLERRSEFKPSERNKLAELSDNLHDASLRLLSKERKVLNEQTVTDTYQKLDEIHREVLNLHETSAYKDVESVYKRLNENLQFMAGPRGPGKGKPGGGSWSGGRSSESETGMGAGG